MIFLVSSDSCFNMIAGPSTTCGPVNVVYTSFVDPTTKIPKTNEDDGRLKKSDLIGLMSKLHTSLN